MNCKYNEYCHRTPEECPTLHNCSLYEEFQRMEGLELTQRLDTAIRTNDTILESIKNEVEKLNRKFVGKIRRFEYK